ncbi:hypothetical protein BDK51DRAFT_36491 [Blyttiomyces helicus]|uniref:Uncharacterized protein n=1 Tax=Blyttiomyces helicus TaxID=388810 RepID=A0A4P9W5J2_9FUNG|nr:hypothetical protein BDK51DRAFT_36491 [Blyttiomyces helicus]|eukprot:RKO86020.1 hypothetical protein BDK51DRAFT_36491 [Blyttiomyces helicus]
MQIINFLAAGLLATSALAAPAPVEDGLIGCGRKGDSNCPEGFFCQPFSVNFPLGGICLKEEKTIPVSGLALCNGILLLVTSIVQDLMTYLSSLFPVTGHHRHHRVTNFRGRPGEDSALQTRLDLTMFPPGNLDYSRVSLAAAARAILSARRAPSASLSASTSPLEASAARRRPSP